MFTPIYIIAIHSVWMIFCVKCNLNSCKVIFLDFLLSRVKSKNNFLGRICQEKRNPILALTFEISWRAIFTTLDNSVYFSCLTHSLTHTFTYTLSFLSLSLKHTQTHLFLLFMFLYLWIYSWIFHFPCFFTLAAIFLSTYMSFYLQAIKMNLLLWRKMVLLGRFKVQQWIYVCAN